MRRVNHVIIWASVASILVGVAAPAVSSGSGPPYAIIGGVVLVGLAASLYRSWRLSEMGRSRETLPSEWHDDGGHSTAEQRAAAPRHADGRATKTRRAPEPWHGVELERREREEQKRSERSQKEERKRVEHRERQERKEQEHQEREKRKQAQQQERATRKRGRRGQEPQARERAEPGTGAETKRVEDALQRRAGARSQTLGARKPPPEPRAPG